ncbi:zinc-binding dehydrogenase [Pendulispora albinea]|uniref:Medium chain dehydrogenase/reductase family protein n=1 Tax=Pendulispora albinea TaxID=2741071 RepID=A0ABZ2M1S5_9BACT
MKRARLERLGEPLVVVDEADPELEQEWTSGIRSGGVAVRMLTSRVISYSKEVFAGRQGRMTFPFPFTPGAGGIGIVEKVADDVEGIAPGERVLLSSYLPSADGDTWVLLGWTGTSAALQGRWPHGTFAERVVWPARCVTPLRGLDDRPALAISVLGTLLVPYGGLLAAGTAAGHVVAVNGANGCFGAAGVVMALAMGASRVLAVGRDAQALEHLRAACGAAVVPVALGGDEARDIAALQDAAGGGPHQVLDFVGQTRDPSATRACIRSLRRGGTAALMGGVQADVPVPYNEAMLRDLVVRGCFMHPPSAPANLVRLAASGRVPLDVFQTAAFELTRVNEAVEHAARDKGLRATVVTMG